MQKITEAARHAFLAGREWKNANTAVEVREYQNAPGKWVILLLHGNPIARYRLGDASLRSLTVCDGGWQTRTTADRLNSLPGVRIHQRAWQWYLNGTKWDGSWTHVSPQYTIHADPLGKIPRWRVDLPVVPGGTPQSLYFPTEAAAAETFVAVEEAATRSAA